MKDKFVIFAEEPPVELQLSVEMRCREIEKNPDIDYIRRYCISLVRNNAKRTKFITTMDNRYKTGYLRFQRQ